MKFVQTILR